MASTPAFLATLGGPETETANPAYSWTTPSDDGFNNVDSFCSHEVNKKIQWAGDAITSLANNFNDAVLPLVGTGTGTNLVLTLLLLRQIFWGGTKKRYLFLLCRALSDTVTCLAMVIIVGHRRSHPTKGANVTAADGTRVLIPFGSPVLSAFVQFDFWILCSTYALLSFVIFIAVRFPFFYRAKMTSRFCCIMLATSITLGVCYSVVCYKLGTTPFLTLEFQQPSSLIAYTPLGKPSRVMAVAIGNAVVILLLWIFVFAQYIGVLIILVRLRAKRSDNRYRAHLSSALRLSASILIWTLTCALMIAAVLSPPLWNAKNMHWLKNYESLDDQENAIDVLCVEMAAIATSLFDLISLSVAAECFWLVRFVVDPFLCICGDRNLRAFCAGNIKRLGTFRISTEKTSIITMQTIA